MKNYLGVEVTKPDKILIIMRAAPGAGKSTLAKKIVGDGSIHSTDNIIESKYDYFEYFKKMKETNDWSLHSKMHYQNFLNAKKDMDNGVSPVIIDNTNIKPSEAKKYVEYALKIGYADENIKFIELGTNGLSAEELAERNTHGVTIDIIKRMIKSMESVGELTLEKVMKSKDMGKKKKFASVVIDETSRLKLLVTLSRYIPKDWEIIAHHMTINFGKGLGPNREEDKGKSVQLVATHIGISNMAVAVKVHGYPSDNAIPHITIAVNRKEGGKPKMSNDIKNWEVLSTPITLNGIITEDILS